MWQGKSAYQDVKVFETETYGKMMTLDGVIQSTQVCVYVWEWLSDVYVCIYGVGCVMFGCVHVLGWLNLFRAPMCVCIRGYD